MVGGGRRVLPLCRDTVSVFFSASRLISSVRVHLNKSLGRLGSFSLVWQLVKENFDFKSAVLFFKLDPCCILSVMEGLSKFILKVVVDDCIRGQPEGSLFNSYYTFPRLLHFTLDTYLILLSVKLGGIKYHFLSLWYDSTWDWTPVSWTIGKHSTH